MSTSIVLQMPTANLVFGMSWFVLLGGNAARLARHHASKLGASHAVTLGQPAALVGVAAPPSSRNSPSFFSAALALACIFPTGSCALICPVANHGWWLSVVHEGLPVARTDRFYSSAEQARATANDLLQAYPRLFILGDPGMPAAPTLAELEAASVRSQPLIRVRHLRVRTGMALAVTAVLSAGLTVLFRQWAAPDASLLQAEANPVVVKQAWQMQVQRSALGHVVQGVTGLQQLLASVLDTPIQTQGWVLTRIACQAPDNGWKCQGHYTRVARGAVSEGLLGAPPHQGRLEFVSLDSAIVHWQPKVHSTPLNLVRLESGLHSESSWLGALQQLQAAFGSVSVDSPSALPLGAPVLPDGSIAAKPSNLSVYVSRQVRVKGPLRSVALLLPHTRFMTWRSVQITLFANGAPSVRTSSLMAEFHGVLYEKSS